MRIVRLAVAVVILLVGAAAIYVWRSQWPLIAKVPPPARSAFRQGLIDKGARLAALGNCRLCHTAPGGADFAGNRAIATPFGTIYSTNITPAPNNAIGHWSEAAFARALRHGISRRGRHLYPAFPYVHYAGLSDADVRALYAFIMTRRPVDTYQQPNELPFPLDQRWLLSLWNLLFFHPAPFRPEPQHSALWNRGAYLVAGLGHCGDCHTPRNLLGAEKSGRALGGGEVEDWTAPALDAASPAPRPWNASQVFAYLRRGWDAEHGAAAGPMQAVSADLAAAEASDVRAIAAYIARLQSSRSPGRPARVANAPASSAVPPGAGQGLGATIFAGACATCHAAGAPMQAPRGIDLALSTVVNEADPRDAIHIVRDGIAPQGEQAGPFMPGFAGAFSDAQLAALLGYIRARYSSGPAWHNLEGRLRDLGASGRRS